MRVCFRVDPIILCLSSPRTWIHPNRHQDTTPWVRWARTCSAWEELCLLVWQLLCGWLNTSPNTKKVWREIVSKKKSKRDREKQRENRESEREKREGKRERKQRKKEIKSKKRKRERKKEKREREKRERERERESTLLISSFWAMLLSNLSCTAREGEDGSCTSMVLKRESSHWKSG